MADDLPGLLPGPGEFGEDARLVNLLQRLHGEQRVDEETIAAWGRDAARRGVWARDKPEVFKVRHDVAHGGGGEIQTGRAGTST